MNLFPVSEGDRIHQLDVIRGFALLGIVLVNMPTFLHPMLFLPADALPIQHTRADEWLRLLFNMFIQTKFYTIFSFLFGAGFYLFMHRAEQKGLPIKRLFARRLWVLLGFGMLHLIFLWYGDILHTYAIAGCILLWFYYKSQKTVHAWAWSLLIFYQGLMTLLLLLPSDPASQQMEGKAGLVEMALQAYNEGAWPQWMGFRLAYEIPYVISNEFFAVITILPLFLLGFSLARQGLFHRTADFLPAIRRVWWTSLFLSLPLVAMIPLLQERVLVLPSSADTGVLVFVGLSGLTLCGFYITSLMLLCADEAWRKTLMPLAFVGRMALSNYVLQTFVFTGMVRLFHIYGKISMLTGAIICLILFVLQIIGSRWWLARYTYGPLEWVWRCLTYGLRIPLRKKQVLK